MKNNILKRFLKYVSFDTTSDPNSSTFPSTESQLKFMKILALECKDIGLHDVNIDRWGYLTATIPATTTIETPVIGFISHVDTSPDVSGKNVNPQVIENYNGEDILLNAKTGSYSRVADFPELKNFVGHTLITTDGTTLLGADDKAGVTEIMSAAEYLLSHPEIKHGKIRICFTPDEEIGHGADHFDVKDFGAEYAYTMDGSTLGSLEYETFNAASAEITIHGRNVHPGYAKNKMINALEVATDINREVPKFERPEYTEGREGFFHLTTLVGNVEMAKMSYIIRDHSRDKFEMRKKQIATICKECAKGDELKINCTITDLYYNMGDIISDRYMYVVERAISAMKRLDITPIIVPVRGGTDGCRLTYMGLPCPNIFTGGENFHSRNEYVCLQTMQAATKVIIEIVTV